MRIVNKIEPRVPQMPTRKKVAAYARVSMESERPHHSLSAQVSHYSGLIQRNPAWEYAGVYADNGVTGTKAEAREEFNRMIADCEAGKIDIVLTKSISRFARNTVDLLNTDVYKRQLEIDAYTGRYRVVRRTGVIVLDGSEGWSIGGKLREDGSDWYYPVSYTHLDVYKRQRIPTRNGFICRYRRPRK